MDISQWVQEHPAYVVGGALGVGLLFFSMAGRSPKPQEQSLTPVDQAEPPEPALTVADFNTYMRTYDDNIRRYIAQYHNAGVNPPTDPPPYGQVYGSDPNHVRYLGPPARTP